MLRRIFGFKTGSNMIFSLLKEYCYCTQFKKEGLLEGEGVAAAWDTYGRKDKYMPGLRRET
jgi:hypothetical protein